MSGAVERVPCLLEVHRRVRGGHDDEIGHGQRLVEQRALRRGVDDRPFPCGRGAAQMGEGGHVGRQHVEGQRVSRLFGGGRP